jgi:hypothetical protein
MAATFCAPADSTLLQIMSVIIQNIFHPLTVTVKVLYTHIRTLGLIQTLYLQLLYEVPGTKLFRVTITDSKFNYTGL